MAYESKQAILEEAGLSQIVVGEILGGLANGTNTVFSTAYGPITDSNDDDVVGAADVTVYVNGSAVAVAGVNAAASTITLAAAPANGATVTCNYRYSNVTDAYVAKIRDEAQDWIDEQMDSVDTTPYTTVPPTIRRLTRQYAAAMLLIREYGMNQNTDGTSKDGYNRLKMVQAGIDKYIEIGGSAGLSDVSAAEVDVYAEPELFSTYNSTNGYVSQDDVFLRDIGVQE
jgi:hypothetical protein